tara:strand:- start:283 stop:948 length:666 start_codon:yes stop_codon:yes gene_type:complete
MKFKFLKTLFTCVILLVASSSHAGLIKTDYLNSGDGLLISDSAQGLNWLSLTLTDGMTYNEATTSFSDFRIATQTEVENMFFTLFPSLDGTFSRGVNNPSYQSSDPTIMIQGIEFGELFGLTLDIPSWGRTRGNYISDNGEYLSVNSILVSDVTSNDSRRLFLNYAGSCNNILAQNCAWNGHSEFGVFMVENTTQAPEPSTLAIFALGMIGLASRRFKKQS